MTNRATFWFAAITLMTAAATVASCTVGPDFSEKRPMLAVPAGYKSPTSQPAAALRVGRDWWRLFADTQLDELEEAGLGASLDLKAAMARVAQARSAANAVKSQFYPTITLDPSVIRSRPAPAGKGAAGPVVTATHYQIPFDLGYEIDIWGRVRRSYESSKAEVQASADDAEVVRQTLLADVAVDYFTIRSLDAQAQIIRNNVDDYVRQLSLTKRQREVGMVGDTEVAQAQALLDSTKPLEIELRRQRADLEHAVAILIGRAPAQLAIPVKPLDRSETAPAIPPGLPADLLRRRPDVAEAEQNLAAACAQIGVAQANFLPVVRLTGAAGFESMDLRNALDWQHRIWSFGPTVSAPIFEGGKLTAALEQAKARYEELEATYRGTVLGAFRDVEDALTDIRLRADEAAAQDLAVASSTEFLRLADIQYRKGLTNYLLVVDADRTKLTNELAAAQILNARLVATVLLIKAIGGGWDPAAPAAATQPGS